MADAGIFVGWGAPIAGRESKGLEVFSEALAYYGKAEGDGRIESHETVLLGPHGGELAGFILVRGSAEQLTSFRMEEEFDRIVSRAMLVVQKVGVVDAAIGQRMQDTLGRYQEAISALA